MIIREAIASDADALAGVFRRSSLSNELDRENLLANPDLLEYPGRQKVEGRTRVAIVHGVPTGFVQFLSGLFTCEVTGLFVDPDFMNQGVGRALLADSLQIARNLGVSKVELTANAASAGFYHKAGFVVVKEIATNFGVAPRMELNISK